MTRHTWKDARGPGERELRFTRIDSANQFCTLANMRLGKRPRYNCEPITRQEEREAGKLVEKAYAES